MMSYDGDEKWEDHDPISIQEDEEEEEEALSLCDLPVVEINGDNKQRVETPSTETENFEFGSCCGSVFTESEMCAADDVFFQGQILPLRPSISSENGLPGNPSRCGSRSESMEHYSSSGFTSMSSTSSRSHHSSNTNTNTTYKPKLRNQFHSHPSPKPQVRSFGSRPGNVSGRSQRWTIWGFFRVGLVQTPEIELRDLKIRNKNKSFNSSSSGSGSGIGSGSGSGSGSEVKLEKKKKQRFLFESCKCSVSAVETVSSRILVIKSNNNNKKVSERGIKEVVVVEDEEEENIKKLKQRKQAMYHKRTFEWLKELSIADVLQEAA